MSEQTSNAPANAPNVRYYVRNVPWFVRINDLNDLARKHDLKAHVLKGRHTGGSRTAFIITKSTEENLKMQQVMSDWLAENFQELRAKASSRSNKKTTADAARDGDAAKEESKEAAKDEDEEKKDTAKDAQPAKMLVPLIFIHLTNTRKKPAPKKESSESAKQPASASASASEKPAAAAAAAATGEKPAASEDSASASEKPASASADSSSAKTGSSESSAGSSGSSRGRPAAQRRTRPPRPPTVKVPRDDAVYVRVPGVTSVEDISKLLDGFSSVEIKLNPLRGFRRKDALSSSEAIITVGAADQQKALDALAGKELHGKTLEPFPSYKRVPENPVEATTESPNDQTSVEHVE